MNTPNKEKLKYLSISLIGFLSLLMYFAYTDYVEAITPKTTDYYRQKSLAHCLDTTQRNTVFVLTEEQISNCSTAVEQAYRGK